MEPSIRKQIQQANSSLGAHLFQAREALIGRQDFSLESIRAISLPLEKIAPVVSQAAKLQTNDADLANDLMEYAETLSALQKTLEQIRFMLLARQTSLQASRTHFEKMNLWAAAFKQTR